MQKYKESLIWQNLFYTAEGMQAVCIFLAIEDSLTIEDVNAHETRRVDNASVTYADAHMDDASLVVLEESKVIALHVTKTNLVTAGHLL